MDFKHLEQLARTSYATGKEYFNSRFSRGDIPRCSPGYISGNCAGGHKFAAPFLCGKEYCKDCGRDGSPIHARRLQRWADIADSFKSLGYLVFTFPEATRFLFLDAKLMANYRYELRRKLARLGYKKGLARWHFFGDCSHCTGYGCPECNNTGAGKNFNPHLNVFIDSGYIENLEAFKEDLSRWQRGWIVNKLREEIKKRNLLLEKYGNSIDNLGQIWEELGAINVLIDQQKAAKYVINYGYTSDKKKKINRLKYVLRSTFRIYNHDIKDALHNFRNCIRWGCGKIKRKAAEPLYCKDCGKDGKQHPVRWHKLTEFNNTIIKHYENGIYTLADATNREAGKFTINTRRTQRIFTTNFAGSTN